MLCFFYLCRASDPSYQAKIRLRKSILVTKPYIYVKVFLIYGLVQRAHETLVKSSIKTRRRMSIWSKNSDKRRQNSIDHCLQTCLETEKKTYTLSQKDVYRLLLRTELLK